MGIDTLGIRNVDEGRILVLDAAILDDPRLSARAIGILVRMLAAPPDQEVTQQWIREEFPGDKDWSIIKAFTDLFNLGYMIRVPERQASGKLRSVLHISSRPIWNDTWTAAERKKGRPSQPLRGLEFEAWLALPWRALHAWDRRPKLGPGAVTKRFGSGGIRPGMRGYKGPAGGDAGGDED